MIEPDWNISHQGHISGNVFMDPAFALLFQVTQGRWTHSHWLFAIESEILSTTNHGFRMTISVPDGPCAQAHEDQSTERLLVWPFSLIPLRSCAWTTEMHNGISSDSINKAVETTTSDEKTVPMHVLFHLDRAMRCLLDHVTTPCSHSKIHLQDWKLGCG